MTGIVERLLRCADIGDMGRKPDPTDVYRVAADTIEGLLAALEELAPELRIMAEWTSGPTSEEYAAKHERALAAIAKAKAS